MAILVLNCGSSSVKFKVIDPSADAVLAQGSVERVERFDAALADVLRRVSQLPISAVGHRVVHGGAFSAPVVIDDAVLDRIRALSPLAPLHNPSNLAGIIAARAALPDVRQVAVFDTAFHARLPRRARTYALPLELCEQLSLRRYGFHGTSHQYVAQRAANFLGRAASELRIISLHLGNGASACAVEFGHSVETSMGATPLEGLVMGTRSGDVDPGVLLTLLRDGKSVDELDTLLNRRSGLLGLSGRSRDLRDLEQYAAQGDDRCRLAINVFAHRVRKYIGAYAAVMGGVDVIVLTAGIGQNSASMRQRLLQRLEFLGVVMDDDRNFAARVSADAPVASIAADNSRVALLVIATDEEWMIAHETQRVVAELDRAPAPRPIAIAVSARHCHLTRETFGALFGAGAELTKLRDISQPGQFAAQQTVNLVGPRDRIDGVRILGPFRSADQVEISRTDEFRLGVDAPVRDSGMTAGSAPIILEGPEGRVSLREGLICARRHIHMTPDDAARHGVQNNDEVEVAIAGGDRDLIFGDVLVRVSDSSRTEMHIDTDEANAAELDSQAQTGELVYAPVLAATAGIRSRRRT